MKSSDKNSLPAAYDPSATEDKIYRLWEKSGYFNPDHLPNSKKRKPYSISMPPPNATGTLHLGHASGLTIEDFLIRYHRLKGEKTLWLPGTDHAAIATQTKVEKLLAKKGVTRHDLGRKKFLKEVEKFVENSQNTIRKQIRKMGSSCDWSRERYTLDEGLSYAVKKVFVQMYKDGIIYRGHRIVNWCPRCESTLADDEVNYQDTPGHFYHIKYPISTLNYLVVATTRPETMLGDAAVAVNPQDKRYKHLIGKKVILPLMNREIPIIGDEYVDVNFGTGALKVTPCHDPNDFELGKKHSLKFINILNKNGTINENGGHYQGLSRETAREKVVEDLKKQGLLAKVEDYNHSVGHCYRCETVIEPFVSDQWFVAVDKPVIKEGKKSKTLKEKAIEAVKKGKIKIVPKRFEKTYFNWMKNLHDWCISRQIWFGHRIPVYYCQNCDKRPIVSVEKPEKCPYCGSKKLTQDPDTLDTWFSSGLWTFSTLGWPKKTKDLKTYHPTAVLETGYDILFFWVARMIIMTTYALREIPFKNVYLHGLIRDKEGRKMSKSLDNIINPLDMISKFGTDALRLSLIIGTTAGNDLKLYEEKIAGFRNFVNKLWNVSRFVLQSSQKEEIKEKVKKTETSLADRWILSKYNRLIEEATQDLDNYRFSSAGEKIYEFLWHDFADWYVEISKIQNAEFLKPILEGVLKLLHPFTPFVTEEIYQKLSTFNFQLSTNLLMVADWPKADEKLISPKAEKDFELIKEIIIKIRNVRAENKIPPAKIIKAELISLRKKSLIEKQKSVIEKLARVKLELIDKKPATHHLEFLFKDADIFLPLSGLIDEEKRNQEINNLENYIESLNKKLANRQFIQRAPKEIIEKERMKLAESEEKLKKLKSI